MDELHIHAATTLPPPTSTHALPPHHPASLEYPQDSTKDMRKRDRAAAAAARPFTRGSPDKCSIRVQASARSKGAIAQSLAAWLCRHRCRVWGPPPHTLPTTHTTGHLPRLHRAGAAPDRAGVGAGHGPPAFVARGAWAARRGGGKQGGLTSHSAVRHPPLAPPTRTRRAGAWPRRCATCWSAACCT